MQLHVCHYIEKNTEAWSGTDVHVYMCGVGKFHIVGKCTLLDQDDSWIINYYGVWFAITTNNMIAEFSIMCFKFSQTKINFFLFFFDQNQEQFIQELLQ
jgi:hypothetical protein